MAPNPPDPKATPRGVPSAGGSITIVRVLLPALPETNDQVAVAVTVSPTITRLRSREIADPTSASLQSPADAAPGQATAAIRAMARAVPTLEARARTGASFASG